MCVFRTVKPLLVALVGLAAWAAPAAPCAAQTKSDKSDRLQVNVFVGEVINTFSVRDHPVVRTAGDSTETTTADSTSTNIEAIAGVEFQYHVCTYKRLRLEVMGTVVHSARQRESDCDSCQTDSTSPQAGDFRSILETSRTIEWSGGARVAMLVNGSPPGGSEGTESASSAETAIYLRSSIGFLTLTDIAGDVVDDHTWVALGIEHLHGVFAQSYLEAGVGRTDVFDGDKRNNRFKVAASLTYTPQGQVDTTGSIDATPKPFSFFLEGFLDSDWGPGSDDVRIYLGGCFRLDKILGG